jgi:hypothetical protein
VLAHVFTAIATLGGTISFGYVAVLFYIWPIPNYWLAGLYAAVTLLSLYAFLLYIKFIWKKEHRLWEKGDDYFHAIFDKHYHIDKDE